MYEYFIRFYYILYVCLPAFASRFLKFSNASFLLNWLYELTTALTFENLFLNTAYTFHNAYYTYISRFILYITYTFHMAYYVCICLPCQPRQVNSGCSVMTPDKAGEFFFPRLIPNPQVIISSLWSRINDHHLCMCISCQSVIFCFVIFNPCLKCIICLLSTLTLEKTNPLKPLCDEPLESIVC